MARARCAWCGKDLGPTTCSQNTDGICPPCARAFEASEELPEWRVEAQRRIAEIAERAKVKE
jgi:recombinational DNA repair protein (RecF pathway)